MKTPVAPVIRPKKWKSLPAEKKQHILYRSQREIDGFMQTVKPIIRAVQKQGDAALTRFTKRFDKADVPPAKFRVSEKEFENAETALGADIKGSLALAVRNVRNYHISDLQPHNCVLSEISCGVFAGKRVAPIESVGLYVPRGKGTFPSMVYMLAVPAAIAKVPRIVMITPPNTDGAIDPACLYAAKIAGIHEVYKVGGAHGVAALTYGTNRIAPVAKIIGPGSAFVTAAKRYVQTVVDVGLPAGPSESVIIADGSTSPLNVAYDLCIEAEHGRDSIALLVTHKKDFASSVCKHLRKILQEAPKETRGVLLAVFTQYPPVLLTDTDEEAIALCNTIAPEHLMIHAASPSFIASDIKNAGEILMGEYTQFSLANYAAGPNAVLPTGGMSKSHSGVSVADFLRETALIKISKNGHEQLAPHVQRLARYEGFHFHEASVLQRKK